MSIKNLNPENIKKLLKEFIGGSEDPDQIEKAYEEMDIQKAAAAADGTLRASNGGCYEISKGVCFKVPKNEDEMSSPARNKGEKFDQSDFGIGVVEYDATIAPEQDGRPMVATVRTAQIRAKDNLRFAGYKGESIPTHHIYTVSGKKGILYVRVVPTGTPIKKETKKPEKAVKGLPNCKPNFECGGVDELEVAQAHGKKSVPTISQVRTALGLGEGGFDDSVIDAIMNFQVANKLRCDGCVGKLTHPVLSKMSKNYTTAVDVPPQKYNISGFYRGLYSGNKPTELLDYIKRTSSRDIFKSGGVVNRNTKKVSTEPKKIVQKKQKNNPASSNATIMTAGDSLLEGKGGIGDQLQRMLPSVNFFRAGKGGMSSGQILRGGRGKPGYLNAVESVSPKILILNGGVNDILSTRKVSVVIRNLEQILKDAKSKNIKVIYIPIVVPTRGTDTIYTNPKTGASSKVFIKKEKAQKRCVEVNKKMQQLCSAYDATYLSGVENTILNKKNKGDNLHLSGQEYRKIAELIKQKIDPILSSIIKESLQKILLGEQEKRPDLSAQAAGSAARRVKQRLRNQWLNDYYNNKPKAKFQAKMGPVEHPNKPGVWLSKHRCKKLKDSMPNLPEDFECRSFFDEVYDSSVKDEFIENDSMSYSQWSRDDGSENFGVPEQIGPANFVNPCIDKVGGLTFIRKDGCKNDPENYERLGLDPVYQWRPGVYAGTCGPGYVFMTDSGPGWVDSKGVYGGYRGTGYAPSFKRGDDDVVLAFKAWKSWLKENGLQIGQCIPMIGQNKNLIYDSMDAWETILKDKKYRKWYHNAAKDKTLKNIVKPAMDMAFEVSKWGVETVSSAVKFTAEVEAKRVQLITNLVTNTSETLVDIKDQVGEAGEFVLEKLNGLGYDYMTNMSHHRRGEYTTAGWIYRETMRGESYGSRPDREFTTEENSNLWIHQNNQSPTSWSGTETSREKSRIKKYNNSMLLFHYGDDERYGLTIKKVSDWMVKNGYFTEQQVDPSLLDKIKVSKGSQDKYITGFPSKEMKIKFFLGMHASANISSSDISSLESNSPSENFRKNYFRQKTMQKGGTKSYTRPGHMAETGVPFEDYEGHIRHGGGSYAPTTLEKIRKWNNDEKMKNLRIDQKSTWFDNNNNNLVDPGELVYPFRGFDGSRLGDNPIGQGWGDGPSGVNFNNEFFGIYKLIVDCLEYQPFALVDYSYKSRMANLKKIIKFSHNLISAQQVLNVVPYFLKHTHNLGFQSNNSVRGKLLTVDYYSDPRHEGVFDKANNDTVAQRVESLKTCHEAMQLPVCKQFGPWKRLRLPEIDKNRAYLVNPLVDSSNEKMIEQQGYLRILFLDDETGDSSNPWNINNIKKKYKEKDQKIEEALRKYLSKTDESVEARLKACCYYGDRFNPSYYFDKDEDTKDNRAMNQSDVTARGGQNERSTFDPGAATHRGGGMYKLLKAKGEKNSHGALAAYTEFFAMLLPIIPSNAVFNGARRLLKSRVISRMKKTRWKARGRFGAKSAMAVGNVSIFVMEAAADVFLTYFFVDSMAQMFDHIGDNFRSTDREEVEKQLLLYANKQQAARKKFLENAIKEIDSNVSNPKDKIGSLENFCSNKEHEMYFVNIFGKSKDIVTDGGKARKEKRDNFIQNLENSKALNEFKNEMMNISQKMDSYNKFLKRETELLLEEIVKTIGDNSERAATLKYLQNITKKYSTHVQQAIIQSGSQKRGYLANVSEDKQQKVKLAINDLIESANSSGMSTEDSELTQLGPQEMDDIEIDPYWDKFFDYYYMLLNVCFYKDIEDEIISGLDLGSEEDYKEREKTQGQRKDPLSTKKDEDNISHKELTKALKTREAEKEIKER